MWLYEYLKSHPEAVDEILDEVNIKEFWIINTLTGELEQLFGRKKRV